MQSYLHQFLLPAAPTEANRQENPQYPELPAADNNAQGLPHSSLS